MPPPTSPRLARSRSQESWDSGLPWPAQTLANLAFVTVLTVLALAPLLQGTFQPWAHGVLVLLVVLAALFWAASLCVGPETHVVFSTINAPLLVLTTYGIVRYSIAEVESVARPQMVAMVTVCLLFFVVLNTLRRHWQVMALVWTVVSLGVCLALVAFWQVLRGGAATGTFPEPGMLAVYLHLAFALAAAFFLFSRRSVNEKVAFAFASLVCIIGLALTQSHWSWLGWSLGSLVLGIYLLRKRGWRFRWVLTGTVTLLVVLGAALIVASRLDLAAPDNHVLVQQLAPGQSQGLNLALDLVRLARRHLLMGAGPGMASWLLPNGWADQPTVLGSEVLTFLAEYGLFGVVLLLWVAGCFGLLAVRILALRASRYSASTPSNRYAFAVAGLALFAVLLLDASTGIGLPAGANLLSAAALGAATLTCGLHHRGSLEDRAPKFGQYSVVRLKGIARYILVGGLVALVALLAMRVHKSYPAHLLVQLGQRKQAHLRWGAAESAYKRAWQLDGRNFAIAEHLADLFAARATWNPTQRALLSQEAIRWYDRCLTLNPHNLDALVKKARLYDSLGQRDKAREYFLQAAAARPTRAAYQTELGLHHSRWHDVSAAQHAFDRALQLDPHNERALQQLRSPDPQ